MPVTITPIKRKGKTVCDLEGITTRVMLDVAFQAKAEFEKTTATWDKKPTFYVTIRKHGLEVEVGTHDEIYQYVDYGTRPHVIVPKAPGYPLRWQSKFTPKTAVGLLGSNPGGATGPRDMAAMKVMHPGTKARQFSSRIARNMDRRMRVEMDRAIKKATQKPETGKVKR